jgi:hypothetical protein
MEGREDVLVGIAIMTRVYSYGRNVGDDYHSLMYSFLYSLLR